jgi:1-deoxy-D-xylulose-5-phosphate synthase
MRLFPNFIVAAPGDELDVAPMLHMALEQKCPVSLRYPKANLERVDRAVAPIEVGQAEIFEWGPDGVLIAYGSLFPTCVKAAALLRKEGVEIGVINARFVKPLDRATLLRAVEQLPLVVTVEEGTLEGGFGSALLEAANAASLDTSNVVRLGLPDRFIEHAERGELLAELGLDAPGIARTVTRHFAERNGSAPKMRLA